MKRLGIVENISYNGCLLVRAEFAPRKEAKVMDKRNRTVGKVKKIFGPVREPFLLLEPLQKVSMNLIGSELYVEG